MQNYQVRMSEEKAVLDAEIKQLASFLNNDGLIVKSTLGPNEISYMRQQLTEMQAYSVTLEYQIKRISPTIPNVNDIYSRISVPAAQNPGVAVGEYATVDEIKVI